MAARAVRIRPSLFAIATGSILLAFTFTVTSQRVSVLGWWNESGGFDWVYVEGAAASAGYAILAWALYRLRTSDWGDSLGVGLISLGLLAGGMAGLSQLAYEALNRNGLIAFGGSTLQQSVEVRLGSVALMWLLIAAGAEVTCRRLNRQPERMRWCVPWWWGALGASLLAVGSLVALWSTLFAWTSSQAWYADVAFALQVAGWLAVALAIARLARAQEPGSLVRVIPAFSAAIIAALSFAAWAALWIAFANHSEVLRWLNVPALAGWLCAAAAACYLVPLADAPEASTDMLHRAPAGYP